MNISPRKLFLLDGIGAIVSALSLGVVLVQFESIFGMPKQVLYCLAAAASIFAIYSLTCYFSNIKYWRPFLKVIAFANLSYCFATAILVFYFYQELTVLGILYFVLEKLIVVPLALFELKTATKHPQ